MPFAVVKDMVRKKNHIGDQNTTETWIISVTYSTNGFKKQQSEQDNVA